MPDLENAIGNLSRGFARMKGIGEADAGASDEILFDEWDREVGTGLYGAFRNAEARGDVAAFDRLARWYDRQIARGLPARQVNSTAPMPALSCLADRLGRQDWRALCLDWAEWLPSGLPKTEEDGFEHVVKEGRRPGQLWNDTPVMAVLFLAQTGRMCAREDMVAETHYQFLTHIRFLADPRTGLFFHGWTFERRRNFARARWARGNARVSIAIPELFAVAPPRPMSRRPTAGPGHSFSDGTGKELNQNGRRRFCHRSRAGAQAAGKQGFHDCRRRALLADTNLCAGHRLSAHGAGPAWFRWARGRACSAYIHVGAWYLGTPKYDNPALRVLRMEERLPDAGCALARVSYRPSGEAKWPAHLEASENRVF